MGTIFWIRNKIRLVIHSRDHTPPHVHIIAPEAEARIAIETLEILEAHGFDRSDLKEFTEFIKERQEKIKEKWDEIHGEK
jgi:uncharacterized protein (DUF885 family)